MGSPPQTDQNVWNKGMGNDFFGPIYALRKRLTRCGFSAITPTPTSPKPASPPLSPQLAPPQGPSQLLTALLARLPDATNRTLIDQAAIDFAFLNSKAARKRLIKVTASAPSPVCDEDSYGKPVPV